MEFRNAKARDMKAVDALLGPYIANGSMLPRRAAAEAFVVAIRGGQLVGAVGLVPLTQEVAEIVSLVAGPRGLGLGRQLVERAISRAGRLGFGQVTALSSEPAFFERCDFERLPVAPWADARLRRSVFPIGRRPAQEASSEKAKTCGTCDRRGSCQQTFLMRPIWRVAA